MLKRILFILWFLYYMVGFVFAMIVCLPYWLITGKNIANKMDSYFDEVKPLQH